MQVKALLRQYGIHPSRRMDQHLLVDDRVAERHIGYANITESDTVLEIGPGIGILTQRLESLAGKVHAVEKDPRMCEILRDRCEKAEIIQGDILKIELPEFNKVVANLPYSISSEITFKLLEHDFELAVLMYQYEFALRMIALPGSKDYSRLSVGTQYYAIPRILEIIPPSAFYPRPEVRSAIVELVPHRQRIAVADEQFFLRFVNAVFTQRRKKMKNAIMNTGHMLKLENAAEIASKLPSDLMESRPGELSVADLAGISNMICELRG